MGFFDAFPALLPKKSVNKIEKINNLKSTIKILSQGTKNGVNAKEEIKEQILELATSLSKLNPTSSISSSPLMTGDWTLLFTTNQGSSAGKLGPLIGRVDQVIDSSNKKYTNFVRIGGNKNKSIIEGALNATWKNIGKSDWEVQFLDLKLTLFNSLVIVNKPLNAEGIWQMTYLDDDFRILYALGGKNTTVKNIYILEKKK